jgi:hypothetical protein
MAIQDKWVIVGANQNQSWDFQKEQATSRPTVTLARLQTMPGPNNTQVRVPSSQITIECPENEFGNFKLGSEVSVTIEATGTDAKATNRQAAAGPAQQGQTG